MRTERTKGSRHAWLAKRIIFRVVFMGDRTFYKVWIRSALGILMLPAALCLPRNWEGLGGRQEVQGSPPESAHFIMYGDALCGLCTVLKRFSCPWTGFFGFAQYHEVEALERLLLTSRNCKTHSYLKNERRGVARTWPRRMFPLRSNTFWKPPGWPLLQWWQCN